MTEAAGSSLLLHAEGVSKRFTGVVAVDRMDLTVDAGELLGLFGPNGAGKTSLFNLIAGTYAPNSGRIEFLGRDITRMPAFRRARMGIGRTFQVVRPFRELTVLENMLAVMRVVGSSGREDGQRAWDLLERTGLKDRAYSNAGELTLGMLKRLEVARALMLSPRLLLLDEPLAGLTGKESVDLLEFVQTLKEQMSVVMVEHNVRLALPICDRAIVMETGRVIAAGAPQDVRRDPAVVRAYLGEEHG